MTKYWTAALEKTLTFSRESIMLVAVCTIDALLTVFLVVNGLAVEANPIMQRCFEYGIAAFCLAKMLPLIPLVSLTEWYKKYNPQFVRKAMRLGTGAYLAFYAIIVISLNVR